MTRQEQRAWIMLVTAIGGYAVYLVIVLSAATHAPLPDIAYVAPLLWTIGGAIAVSIVVGIVAGIVSSKESSLADQRDRDIARFGDAVGRAFLVIGGVGALLLALVDTDGFWIANLLYLAFVCSAVFGGVAKLAAYRRGIPAW
ncbi:MAG TPA: hypothetical protein VNJ54_00850 [Plantibacter sp.]|uniref:hypothetical protein n=1 Tax=unclassified Plantibacter TaxID=2624265 RepID=UPI002B5AA8C2|nr:hypothetical protein [Plantibacter sp.]